jgi:hypothetical protein
VPNLATPTEGTTTNTAIIWRFGVFEFDTQGVELRRSGVPIKLRDQSSRILIYLLEHAGQMVTREELRQYLWPSDTFVDFDHSLNTAVIGPTHRVGWVNAWVLVHSAMSEVLSAALDISFLSSLRLRWATSAPHLQPRVSDLICGLREPNICGNRAVAGLRISRRASEALSIQREEDSMGDSDSHNWASNEPS